MANTVDDMGTGTISATTAGPGSRPYASVTGSFTASNIVSVAQKGIGASKDVNGPYVITCSRVNDTTAYFYADRQLPADEEIVFDWTSCSP